MNKTVDLLKSIIKFISDGAYLPEMRCLPVALTAETVTAESDPEAETGSCLTKSDSGLY